MEGKVILEWKVILDPEKLCCNTQQKEVMGEGYSQQLKTRWNVARKEVSTSGFPPACLTPAPSQRSLHDQNDWKSDL